MARYEWMFRQDGGDNYIYIKKVDDLFDMLK